MAKKAKTKATNTAPKSPVEQQSKARGPLLPLGIVLAVIISLISLFYGNSQNEGGLLPGKVDIPCATRIPPKGECMPKNCFRAMSDSFVSEAEVKQLKQLVSLGMSMGGGSGPPSILDLSSGALSYKDKFIDVFSAMEHEGKSFPTDAVKTYLNVTNRIRQFVEQESGAKGLRLTGPTFFSRIRGGVPAVTPHDEYWHEHVDKQQYGSFVYTTLVYLNDHGTDFTGGEFTFVDTDESKKEMITQVLPKAGKIVAFTSGFENVHRVLPVESGVRYALTTAFTCDKTQELTDFLQRALQQ